jgi:hypothetical protein
VHDGHSSEHRNEAVHLLRRFVQDLLLFQWENRTEFVSLQEACEFLSWEPDRVKLERRVELLQLAVRFITPRDDDGASKGGAKRAADDDTPD